MPLTDTRLRQLKSDAKPYKVSDGGGLYVLVNANGSKLWRLKYRFNGKEKVLSFGSYPETTLARARERRSDAKTLLADGIDPAAHAKAEKEEDEALNEHTFALIAAELMEKLRKEGKAETTLHKKQWLLDKANDDFGSLPIRLLTPATVLETVRKVEALGNYESAKRLRSTIGQVCRYAVATARADNDPTYALRGALIAPKVTHMAAATTRDEFAEVVQAVWEYDGGAPSTRAALKLMALLYTRPGELRLALWEEFDLEAATWTIPASRTKMRREHVKHVAPLAVQILRDLRRETGSNYRVFPSSIARDKPISENTLNQALRRMGFEKDQHTSHGFRASASTLLNESGLWDKDAIEAELAHVGADQVRRAYHRALYWDERVKMAEWWASEIQQMLNGNRGLG
ncbi:tyrosine-type recombinase/integrase [Hyphomonas johnsonii]|uniref:Phage integrase family site specific recombinase n=1 Tax=Hyphomonas johnsonii MHS-2 TaxID=1280950 RepID=A0A059FNJ8_9PROT|nr:integrase arm-type DNA-binding domain-containing protein [Hyphomonas johnsonii]KCZ92197.1 phage integrase family site specific recombinase [Hyphomonas johnsonii MHS-2]